MEERERLRVPHPEGGRKMVKQSQVDGTDLNLLMRRWRTDGTGLAHLNKGEASYGDFSSGLDYLSALNAVEAAKADFMRLPSNVRAHVRNDPGELLAMIYDPERRDELEELGLVNPRAPSGAREEDSGAAGAAGVKTAAELTSAEAPPEGD